MRETNKRSIDLNLKTLAGHPLLLNQEKAGVQLDVRKSSVETLVQWCEESRYPYPQAAQSSATTSLLARTWSAQASGSGENLEPGASDSASPDATSARKKTQLEGHFFFTYDRCKIRKIGGFPVEPLCSCSNPGF